MKNKTASLVLLLTLIMAQIVTSCAPQPQAGPAGATPTAAQEPQPTLVPTQPAAPDAAALSAQPDELPPQVIDLLPAQDEEAQPDASIQLTFDQPMQRASVEDAFTLADPDGQAVPGDFDWPGSNTLRFTPRKALETGAVYTVTLDSQAANANGVAMETTYTAGVHTLTPLKVSQVFPADQSADVDVSSRITVMFNRPVTPLGVAEDQDQLPQPLAFSPELPGQGEWVNTSVYVFTPDRPLKSGVEYMASLPAGLEDARQDPHLALEKDYRWRFTTLPPTVYRLESGSYSYDAADLGRGQNISPLPSISLYFAQPMDRASTVQALAISGPDDVQVPYRVQWDAAGQTLTVTAARYLGLDTGYTLTLDGAARSLDGGPLGSDLVWHFKTIPAPEVSSTKPRDGEKSADAYSLTLRFASPMNPETIQGRVQISPQIEDPGWWYNENEQEAVFYQLQPSTTYTVTLLPGMQDIYGNAINQPQTIQFTTAPIAAQAYLNMPYNALYRAGEDQQFFFSTTNVDEVSFSLYRLDTQQYIDFMENYYGPEEIRFPDANLVWEDRLAIDAGLDYQFTKKVGLQDGDGGALEPGFYYLGLDSPQVDHNSGRFVDGRFLVVSQAYLTFKNSPADSLLWATDPESGKPLKGLALQVYDGEDHLLGEGVTDSDGLLHVDYPAGTPDGSRYAVSAEGSPFAFASRYWDSSVSLYSFDIQPAYGQQPYQDMAYVYTDRPLYRPGQPVYFKGIVRHDDDLDYQIPEQKEVEVVISSYDDEVYHQSLPLDEFGSFHGQLDLDGEATLGSYTIQVAYSGSDTPFGWASFTLAEYRKPEFQIDLSTSPANLSYGERLRADLSASYYSGGGLDGAGVDWSLRSDAYYFQPPEAYSGYSFYDEARDAGSTAYRPYEEGGRLLAQGHAVTAGDGSLSLDIPVTDPDTTSSRLLTLETDITDFAGSLVSAQAQSVVHSSQVYAGVRPDGYLGQAGKEQAFNLVALDWDGYPVAGQRLEVTISQRQWYSVQVQDASGRLSWETSVKDIPVSTQPVTTGDDGLAQAVFTPAEGGVYRAVVTARDARGGVSRSAAYLWVAGADYVPWRQTNDLTFDLVLDQDSYQVGDTAEILIASPFQGENYALVTVERGRVRSQDVLLLKNNSTLYRLPVSADMAPDVYVTVTVIQGIDADNPRPAYKIGMARLNVDTGQYALAVSVEPDQEQAAPGAEVTYTVQTTNAAGEGVPAQVSLGLSDLATLSLMPPNTGTLMDYFYAQRDLSVNTALSISASVENYNDTLEETPAEGRSAGSGGGKGGGEAFGVPEVRQDFPDTAFWKADLVTGQDGSAQVTVKLPDNLTTWRMDARAVTADTAVGQSEVDVVSSRPLLVRPQTPRFFVNGDRAVLGAAVHNNTGQDLDVTVRLDAQGVELEGDAAQQVSIAAGQQAYVTWPVSVPQDVQRVDLVFSAEGGAYQDASRPTLGSLDDQGIPVYTYTAPETATTAGVLTAGGARTEGIRLPDGLTVTGGQLNVELEPSLAASMTAGLDYLEHYPYECIEQTVSRFLPNVLTAQALKTAGIQDDQLSQNLETQVNTALQRLYAKQLSDGGWSWWDGSTSHPLTSAYAVYALGQAQRAGYAVDKDVLRRGLTYLSSVVRQPYSTAKSSGQTQRNQAAFLLYVLADAGKPDVNRTVKLYDDRDWLQLYARGYLAQTLALIDPDDPRLDTLLADLVSAAQLSGSGAHWEEEARDWRNWNTDTRTTAILLDTLVKLDPQNDLAPNVVRWLMSVRSQGHWDTTQETAWTIQALSDWMATSGELEASYAY
jgi:uncharacterized protein YfaS (alpha-2-macroglobulin family)